MKMKNIYDSLKSIFLNFSFKNKIENKTKL